MSSGDGEVRIRWREMSGNGSGQVGRKCGGAEVGGDKHAGEVLANY
jgi:hypothetical protein